MSGEETAWVPGMRVIDVDGDAGVIVHVVGQRLRISYGCTGSGRRWDDLLAWQVAHECKVHPEDPSVEVGRLRAEVERLTLEHNGQRQNAEAYQRQCKRLRARVEAAEREVERLTRERSAAVKRAESDGRVVVRMGKRNREMMAERAAAISRAEVAEREVERLTRGGEPL